MAKNNFADQLAKYRKQCGFTQEALAGMLNVTPQAVSKWEKGSFPDGDLLPKIAKALHISLDVLFGLKPEEKVDPTALITETIQSIPEGERADYCMNLFYAVINAYSNIQSSEFRIPEKLLRETYAQLKTDQELALARLNEDMQYFCFLKIPFFRLLSRREALQILYFFGATEHNHLWSEKQIASQLHIPPKVTSEVLGELDRAGAIWKLKVDNGADDVYGYTHSIPLETILVLSTSFINYLQYTDPNIESWNNGAFKVPEINLSLYEERK